MRVADFRWPNRLQNEEVRISIRHAIRLFKDILTSVRRRKLKWYEHITR